MVPLSVGASPLEYPLGVACITMGAAYEVSIFLVLYSTFKSTYKFMVKKIFRED